MLSQIEGFDATASRHPRRKTYGVKVGHITVGGSAPIVVQSMTNTDTADVETTLKQTLELAEAGSEIVRWTVNVPEAAAGRGLQRANHRGFSLQRARAADEVSGMRGGSGQVPYQSGQRGRGAA